MTGEGKTVSSTSRLPHQISPLIPVSCECRVGGLELPGEDLDGHGTTCTAAQCTAVWIWKHDRMYIRTYLEGWGLDKAAVAVKSSLTVLGIQCIPRYIAVVHYTLTKT